MDEGAEGLLRAVEAVSILQRRGRSDVEIRNFFIAHIMQAVSFDQSFGNNWLGPIPIPWGRRT